MPRNRGIASGETTGRKPGGWDEISVGAAGDEASAEMYSASGKLRRYALWLNLPNRRVRDPYARWCGRGAPRGVSLSRLDAGACARPRPQPDSWALISGRRSVLRAMLSGLSQPRGRREVKAMKRRTSQSSAKLVADRDGQRVGSKAGTVAKKLAVSPESEYAKYFKPPTATPGSFVIFDITDGGSISTTSHT